MRKQRSNDSKKKWQQISKKIWFGHFGAIIINVYKDKDNIWHINLPDGLVVTKATLPEAKKWTESYIKVNRL